MKGIVQDTIDVYKVIHLIKKWENETAGKKRNKSYMRKMEFGGWRDS